MRVFQMAMAKSVREVLLPAVDKATSIAVVTTMKIVLKDFATEVDEMKLKAAAIGMVRHLSQSLARTTAVEPLKEVIVSTTHSLAPNLMGMQNSFVDELNTAINDNLGVALAIIEKAAMDKATQDIGEQLMQPIAIRRYHKERRAGQPFLTQNTNPYSLTLPEPLGLKSSGVTPQQFSIYENLGDHGSNFEKRTGCDRATTEPTKSSADTPATAASSSTATAASCTNFSDACAASSEPASNSKLL